MNVQAHSLGSSPTENKEDGLWRHIKMKSVVVLEDLVRVREWMEEKLSRIDGSGRCQAEA